MSEKKTVNMTYPQRLISIMPARKDGYSAIEKRAHDQWLLLLKYHAILLEFEIKTITRFSYKMFITRFNCWIMVLYLFFSFFYKTFICISNVSQIDSMASGYYIYHWKKWLLICFCSVVKNSMFYWLGNAYLSKGDAIRGLGQNVKKTNSFLCSYRTLTNFN